MRVHPRAKRTAVLGVHAGSIKISLQAPPVDGAANEALVAFLAKRVLGVPRTCVSLARGSSSRDKVLAVDGMDASAVCAAIRSAWR